MRIKFLVSILIALLLFPAFSFSQIKPQLVAKTYYCAKVEDILINPKDFSSADKISVGVRLSFKKQSYIPGAPGQRLCDCAFEGPSKEHTKGWTKTISLRLIGLKYSDKEINTLEYYGPTPTFPIYTYGGLQVIGVTITERDLNEGFKDVFGWTPKKNPFNDSREFKIHAALDINGYPLKRNDDPDYPKRGCFPSEDFVKNFKPKQLDVLKLKEDTVKREKEKGVQSHKVEMARIPKVTYVRKELLRLPPEKFLLEKLPPITFKPFNREYFKIPPTQDTITLKNGKTLKVEKFLEEVNELEKWLNKSGYSLRPDKDKHDKTKPIKIKYIYPKDQFKLQRGMLAKDILKEDSKPSPPPQITCEDYSTEESSLTGRPKDFVPLDWGRKWDASFGNEDFGVNLNTNLAIQGNKENLDINPFFKTGISFLGNDVEVLKIEKQDDYLIGTLLGKELFNQSLSSEYKETLLNEQFKWGTELSFPVGPINIEGEFGFEGSAIVDLSGKLNAISGKADANVSSKLYASAYGELGASYEIVSVGVGAKLILIDNTTTLNGNLELVKSPSLYFKYSADATNRMELLSGRLYVYGEVDYLIDSKHIEVEIYEFDGFQFDQTIFSVKNSVPAEKDHRVWLKIDQIKGITPYTARNEKLDIEPKEFDVIVEIGGRRYTKTLKDYNKDGKYGGVFGEYGSLRYEIPLLSFKKVPIGIEVTERYKVGTLDFKNTLDLAPGAWKKVELCYDPKTRTFSGTKSGKEDEEIRSVGDSTYWGERYHQIIFELTTQSPVKAAPAKAK